MSTIVLSDRHKVATVNPAVAHELALVPLGYGLELLHISLPNSNQLWILKEALYLDSRPSQLKSVKISNGTETWQEILKVLYIQFKLLPASVC